MATPLGLPSGDDRRFREVWRQAYPFPTLP